MRNLLLLLHALVKIYGYTNVTCDLFAVAILLVFTSFLYFISAVYIILFAFCAYDTVG